MLEVVWTAGLIIGSQVFMNIVLDEAFEEKQGGEKVAIGMVVSIGIVSLTSMRNGTNSDQGHPR